MKLKIAAFADAGNHEKERLVIEALLDLDIGSYAVFCSKGGPVAGEQLAYWFADGAIKAGDLVILYTKPGRNSKKNLGGGRTARFYYWGQRGVLWNDESNAAVVIELGDWISGESEGMPEARE
jgi:hypothetical protein